MIDNLLKFRKTAMKRNFETQNANRDKFVNQAKIGLLIFIVVLVMILIRFVIR